MYHRLVEITQKQFALFAPINDAFSSLDPFILQVLRDNIAYGTRRDALLVHLTAHPNFANADAEKPVVIADQEAFQTAAFNVRDLVNTYTPPMFLPPVSFVGNAQVLGSNVTDAFNGKVFRVDDFFGVGLIALEESVVLPSIPYIPREFSGTVWEFLSESTFANSFSMFRTLHDLNLIFSDVVTQHK
jgi:hypothetical protein